MTIYGLGGFSEDLGALLALGSVSLALSDLVGQPKGDPHDRPLCPHLGDVAHLCWPWAPE